jgi:hypothetical protein
MKKKLRFLLPSLAFSATILSVFLFSSCGSDDDNKAAIIDITNPNAVAKAVVIENSTYVATGNPPAQTISETAPVLDISNDGKPLFNVQGSKIIVSASLQTGSASGFYVKVVGADGYYKVTSTSATGRLQTFLKTKRNSFGKQGRTQEDGDATFSIEVPENIKPGEFCISYCVYDAQNQVSNVIQQCVTVKSLGGANSSFLSANNWEFVKSFSYENDQLVYQSYPGTPDSSSYWTEISCHDTSYVEVYAHEEFITNYVYITYAANGALNFNIQDYEKYLDYENSDCEPIYTENTETQNITGAWSYDSDSKILIMVYNLEYEGGVETVGEQYEASIVDNNLVLKVSYSDTEYDVITLKPKN